MLVLRSLLFNVVFYANMVVWMIALTPCLALPRRYVVAGVRAWSRLSVFLLRMIAGTKVEFRGRENVPPGGLLVACKHQSMWETFALTLVFEDPAYILKRELTRIPLFGWLAVKAGMIAVDREAGAAAMTAMTRRARAEVARGRQILIFPEGTRRPPGAPPAYKAGIGRLYGLLGVPCLPVALNSGLFWPRRKFLRRPGTIVVEFLPIIPPGMDRRAMMSELERRIEEASNRLLDEGRTALHAADAARGREPAPSS